jgi:hypothetical protein
MRTGNLLTLIPVLMLAASGPPAEQSRLQVSEPSFAFEIFDPAQPVEHAFSFHNSGADTIQVERIALTSPLRVDKVLSKIAPNQDGQLIVSLGTPRELGEYAGAIEVSFKNKDLAPVRLEFSGKITPVIEVRPVPAFFIATTRGRTDSASLEIVNQDPEPMQITEVPHSSSRYALKLATVEPGRRYRLELVMRSDAKPGRQTEEISLLTSSKKQPRLVIQANTLVRERVYTFPESIDLGLIRRSELKANPGLTNWINQTLMVYQEGGNKFQLSARTDLDTLKLEAERSNLGDRYEIHVQVAVNRLAAGPINGFIRIKTNDPEFPELTVPVQGGVE